MTLQLPSTAENFPLSFFVTSPLHDGESKRPGIVFWIAAITLFAVALSPHDLTLAALNAVLDRIYVSPDLSARLEAVSGKFFRSTRAEFLDILVNSVAIPTKKVLFVASFLLLVYPVLRCVMAADWARDRLLLHRALKRSALVFFGLMLLVTPIGLKSLGDGYGRMSLAPYAEPAGLFSRRFLAPAIAELFGMSGYLYFFLFSLLVAFGVIFFVILWLNRQGIELGWLPLLSLCTSSFVIFNFEMPGYVDQLMIMLALLMAATPMSSVARLGIVALAMATHELSLVIFIPLVMLFGTAIERKGMVILGVVYGSLFLILNASWFGSISTVHSAIPPYGKSPLQFFIEEPGLIFLGILASHKLLWIFPVIAAWRAFRRGSYWPAVAVLFPLLFPLFTLPFAIDTSRLMGWGFAGVLLALLYLVKREGKMPQYFMPLMLVNLLVPSLYIGLNTGPLIFPGLYKILYGWMW